MKHIKENGCGTEEELYEEIIFKKNNIRISYSRTSVWSMIDLKVGNEDSEIKMNTPRPQAPENCKSFVYYIMVGV